jgi:hypothetical protein
MSAKAKREKRVQPEIGLYVYEVADGGSATSGRIRYRSDRTSMTWRRGHAGRRSTCQRRRSGTCASRTGA